MINHRSLNIKQEILAAWSSWLLKSGGCQNAPRAPPRSPGEGGWSEGGRLAGHAGPAPPLLALPPTGSEPNSSSQNEERTFQRRGTPSAPLKVNRASPAPSEGGQRPCHARGPAGKVLLALRPEEGAEVGAGWHHGPPPSPRLWTVGGNAATGGAEAAPRLGGEQRVLAGPLGRGGQRALPTETHGAARSPRGQSPVGQQSEVWNERGGREAKAGQAGRWARPSDPGAAAAGATARTWVVRPQTLPPPPSVRA